MHLRPILYFLPILGSLLLIGLGATPIRPGAPLVLVVAFACLGVGYLGQYLVTINYSCWQLLLHDLAFVVIMAGPMAIFLLWLAEPEDHFLKNVVDTGTIVWGCANMLIAALAAWHIWRRDEASPSHRPGSEGS